jgi:Transglycosylase SLT domain
MAQEAPNSYKDPYWSDLALNTEKKLGLPSGLLSSIVLNGEKSNANQTSEAGAKTPFQIIPSTRNALIKKYGIDPYLSPENAAEGAGLLLKESLSRNKGDIPTAVAEYHGGTNRDNWGSRTKAYVQRVTAGHEADKLNQLSDGFSQWLKDNPAKQDLNLSGQQPQPPNPDALDQGFKQYLSTQGTPGHPLSDQIPGATSQGQAQPTPDQSLTDQVVGGAEAALNALTGMTTGAIGQAAGTVYGIGKTVANGTFGTPQGVQEAEDTAAQAGDALTYSPVTQAGQNDAQKLGDFAQNLVPLAGVTGELAQLHQSAPLAVQGLKDAARPAVVNAIEAVKHPIDTVMNAFNGNDGTPPASGGGGGSGMPGSAGAAATDPALRRITEAANLPVPINDLTTGQATRDFDQTRFEHEEAKKDTGKKIRDRFEKHQNIIQQNLDSMVDDTGAINPDAYNMGVVVDDALRKKMNAKKNEIEVAYATAHASPEAQFLLSTQPLTDYINSHDVESTLAPSIDYVKAKLLKMGGASIDSNGELVPNDITIRDSEFLRRNINNAIKADHSNEYNKQIAIEMKKIVDDAQEPVAGDLYKKARELRTDFGKEFKNRAVINDILRNKTGTDDRAIGFEHVFNQSVLSDSVTRDDVLHLKNSLLDEAAGDEGKQAWSEIQGKTIEYIKDEITKSSKRDTTGNPKISVDRFNKAIRKLDKNGKLDVILGKKNAEIIRTIGDLSLNIFAPPPGAVNASGSATLILEAINHMGMAGIPKIGVILSKQALKYAKEYKNHNRIENALAGKPLPKPKGKK